MTGLTDSLLMLPFIGICTKFLIDAWCPTVMENDPAFFEAPIGRFPKQNAGDFLEPDERLPYGFRTSSLRMERWAQ
jgi:hypothetical protein